MTTTQPAIDAYAHVGQPRFGSADEAVETLERWGIRQAVLVLGPGVPDLEALHRADALAGDRVRFMGIPFGQTLEQRVELAEAQLSLGISGMRLMPFELEPNGRILDSLGERGLWLFAINPFQDPQTTRRLLDWLDRFEAGRVCAPHFLRAQRLGEGAEDAGLLRTLLEHPRFYAILSRHGGASGRPYPHEDLRPWVEDVVQTMGWGKLLWGSEHPVLYWRNEQIGQAMSWLDDLGFVLNDADRRRFLHDNARRLFFDAPPPPRRQVDAPVWVAEQFVRQTPVPLLPHTPIHLPMDRFAPVLSDFLRQCRHNPNRRLAEYLAEQLGSLTERLERRSQTP